MKVRAGFRAWARKRKARKNEKVSQDSPTKTIPQIYAVIPGHEIAEVVEMVYTYKGRRRKLKYIYVQWPHIGPNRRRFEMTPFIRLKKRKKAARWKKTIIFFDKQARRLVRFGLTMFKKMNRRGNDQRAAAHPGKKKQS